MAAAERDPRYVYNMVMRKVAMENGRTWPTARHGRPLPQPKRRIKIDWAVSLEKGYVPQNQFPAKYQFGVTTENCNSDYVLFGLTVTFRDPGQPGWDQ